MTKLSRLRRDLKDYEGGNLAEISSEIYELRQEFKQSLSATSQYSPTQPRMNDVPRLPQTYSIIFCKHALGHISVNLMLLELHNMCPKDSDLQQRLSSGKSTYPEDYNGRQMSDTTHPSEQYLNTELEGLVELVASSFQKATLVTPMSCLRVVSSYRVICAQVFKQKDYHPVWNRIHTIICGPTDG